MSTKHGSLSTQECKRLLAGELILKDYDNDEIADIVEVSVSSVRKWRKKLKDNGDDISVLHRKAGSGNPSTLNDEQKQQLKEIILGGAIKAGYSTDRWTSKIVADCIKKTFDVVMAPRTVRDLLPTLGLSPQMPVVKSHKHDDEVALRWAKQTWKRLKKKAKKLGIPLIFWDETGFSLSPIRGTTWAEIGKPAVLRNIYSRQTQTGLGWITMTPVRQKLNFRFTIFDGAITTLDVILFLSWIRHYYGTQVMIIWDSLSSHLSARNHFERKRPDWFIFVELPPYCPELNPVEQCWNMMKNVYMANFVPLSIEHLEEKTFEVASIINSDPKLLAEFFNHAKLKL